MPKPMCRACRRRRAVLICEYCGKPFRAKGGHLAALFCCRSHANSGKRLVEAIENSQDQRGLEKF